MKLMHFGFALSVSAAISSSADILVINGNGSSTVAAPLTAAGFTVIQDSFNPGVIASHLGSNPNISQIWIWNDGTFGNTGSPVVPSRSFDAADQAALTLFNLTHSNWIMDGLSWRANSNADEQNFSKNEAMALQGAGGGIVLGADDASGAAILQHVNQVTGWFNFDPFTGVYLTAPGSQQTGGTFFTSPNAVNPSGVVGTTTYSEAPNGSQPNGLFLGTAVFGEGTPLQGYTPGVVPDLPSQVFNGNTYPHVNHLVTTTIPGASIDPILHVPDAASTFGLMALGICALMIGRRWLRLSDFRLLN